MDFSNKFYCLVKKGFMVRGNVRKIEFFFMDPQNQEFWELEQHWVFILIKEILIAHNLFIAKIMFYCPK